jgi:cytoskeletal protein CcmA (bactofilin family)
MPLSFWKSRPQPAPSPGEDMVGYFEPSVELEGIMKVAAGMIRLNTHFKGAITSQGTVVVAGQGEVEASIQAKLVSVAGKVKGNVHASDRLEIKEHGVVLGEIYTRVLVVEPGGYLEGQCHMPTEASERGERDQTNASPQASH